MFLPKMLSNFILYSFSEVMPQTRFSPVTHRVRLGRPRDCCLPHPIRPREIESRSAAVLNHRPWCRIWSTRTCSARIGMKVFFRNCYLPQIDSRGIFLSQFFFRKKPSETRSPTVTDSQSRKAPSGKYNRTRIYST